MSGDKQSVQLRYGETADLHENLSGREGGEVKFRSAKKG